MVSMQGEDEPECLTASWTTPCRTITYIVGSGRNVVCLKGKFQAISEHIEITNNTNGKREITIICYSISSEIVGSKVTLRGKFDQIGYVSFVNFRMISSDIQLRNIHVTFKNVVLEQVNIYDQEKTPNQVYFEKSSLTCFDSETCGLSLLNSTVAKCVISWSYLNNFKLDLNTQSLMLIINDTFIHQSNIQMVVDSPPYLRIPSFIQFHNVTVSADRNTNNTHSPKGSIQNLPFNSEMLLILTNPYFKINKCDFNQTHLEIVAVKQKYSQAYFWGEIKQTKFTNSLYEGNGGALTVVSEVLDSTLIISSCAFTNNTAVKGNTVFKGSGGGVSIISASLNVEIENTLFLNNAADDVGLALYTSEGVSVYVSNCSFHYTIDPYDPIQNEPVYIAGTVTQMQGRFQVSNFVPESYVGPISAFYLANGNNLDIEIRCPEWYWQSVEYNSPSSDSKSIRDVRYKCNPCSDNYYTISGTESYLSYDPSSNGSVVYTGSGDLTSDICSECPYGAICTGNNVMPRPNYWGYWHMDELVFQQCPAGYCCSNSGSSTCSAYDYCAGNKTGILCGACQEGFSVSILTGVCIPDSQCGEDQWFWLVAFSAAMAYAFWYTLKDDIFAVFFGSIRFVKQFCNCYKVTKTDVSVSGISEKKDAQAEPSFYNIENIASSINVVNDHDVVNHSDVNKKESEDLSSQDDVDKGYFGILTYYVQMAAVIKIQIEFSDIDESESFIDTILNNIARFLNLELTQMTFDVCPMVGLTTVGKYLYNLFFLLGIYVSWAGVFTVTLIIVTFMYKVKQMESSARKVDSFKLRLVGGLIEIIKYTYAGFCGIIFSSLVCAQIGNKYVWWYDGTNVCLEKWQVVIVIFAAFYAVPFPLTLALGMKLLKENKISPVSFVCCCLFPLLGLIFMLLSMRINKYSETEVNSSLSDSSETIVSVLQGPYLEDEKHFTLYWEAMVSFRRLLITGLTLVPNASIQMIIITTLCLIFLIQHIYMSPFRVRTSNDIEALSLTFLVLTSVINLLKASLTDSVTVPSGPSVPFFKTMELCEKLFVLLIIAYIIFVEIKLRRGKKKNKNIKNSP